MKWKQLAGSNESVYAMLSGQSLENKDENISLTFKERCKGEHEQDEDSEVGSVKVHVLCFLDNLYRGKRKIIIWHVS